MVIFFELIKNWNENENFFKFNKNGKQNILENFQKY